MNFKMDQNAQAARQAYGAGVSDLVDEKEPSKEEKINNVKETAVEKVNYQ